MRKVFSLISLILLIVLPVKAMAQTATISSFVNQATPSGASNTDITKSANLFMARVKAAVFRADRIAQKISRRNSVVPKLNLGQKALTDKLDKAKIDLSQLDMQSQVLTASGSSPKNYLLFKSQALSLIKNLKDIYKTESDLIVDMKKIATVAATPVISAVPTMQ